MPPAPATNNAIPRGIAIAVVLIVIAGIAIVLLAQRIPHAARPSFKPTPLITTITITQSSTP